MRQRADELAPEVGNHIWRSNQDFFHRGCDGQWRGLNGLALSRFSVIYVTPPCVITPRSPVQGSRAVQEHPCLTRPYVSKARTLPRRDAV
jgi:hypothetical protein